MAGLHYLTLRLFGVIFLSIVPATNVGLNISTKYQTMPDKKMIYVQRKLLHNGHSCPTWSSKKIFSYRRFKTQKHWVSVGLSCSGFSFYGHFNRQLTYAVFVAFKTVRCVWAKIFFVSFFALLRIPSPLKTFICHYIAQKSLKKVWTTPDFLK